MATLSFTIPDTRMAELVEAWGAAWTAEVDDPANPGEKIPNPQTKPQFAKEQIKRAIIDHIQWYQGQQIEEIPIT
jgi:hypothetical protein